MNMKFLRSNEKKKLLSELTERFGITKLPYLLVETGKQKIRGFNGTMTKEEIKELGTIANVEIVGMYLVKKDDRIGVRLSLDATKVLADETSKNIIQITKDQLESWLRGENLEIEKPSGVYVIKHNSDYIGCGVSDRKKIVNYVPRERRIRKS